MRLRVFAAAAVLTAIVTACAPPGPGSGTPSPTGPAAIQHPTGSTDLLLRIDVTGGFVSPEMLFTRTPEFSLFGDGTLVVPGAQTAIYPGPALPSLIGRTVTEEAIQAILRDGLDAGLDGDAEFVDMGHVMIADATTTVFTLTANGETHKAQVYALGFPTERPDGMPSDEWQARWALGALEAHLSDLSWLPEGALGAEAPFAGEAAAIAVRAYAEDPQLPQNPMDWPLETPLASFGSSANDALGERCGVVSGQDWPDVESQARHANQLTPWTSRGERFALAFRPLLPDETGC